MTKTEAKQLSLGNGVMKNMEFDWATTCEKCLGQMVKRRVISNDGPKFVMQCKRCRFHHDID